METAVGNVRLEYPNFSLPWLGDKSVFPCSSEVESRLPTAPLLIPVAFQPVKKAHLPYVTPQTWGAQCVVQIAHFPGQISANVFSFFLWVLSLGHWSQYDCLPFLPNFMWTFLKDLVVYESCCQFAVSFQWELLHIEMCVWSDCGIGKSHIFLYHLDWQPLIVCCCSVAKSCPTICNPMDYSTPGLSFTTSESLFKLMYIDLMMPSNHLILCCHLLLLPSIFPSIRVFSIESPLRIRWPKYWSFRFTISPSNVYSGLISFRIDWLNLLAVQGTLKGLL